MRCFIREFLDQGSPGFVPSQDERRDVNGMLSRPDLLYKRSKRILAGAEKLESIAAYGSSRTIRDDRAGGGQVQNLIWGHRRARQL